MFPRLLGWIENRKQLKTNAQDAIMDNKVIMKKLKETLNPNACRGFIDCFLIRKQKEEVRLHWDVWHQYVEVLSIQAWWIYHLYQDSGVKGTHFNDKNLLFSITNLFGAGTDTTATTLQWILLLMAKYPKVQGSFSAVVVIRHPWSDHIDHFFFVCISSPWGAFEKTFCGNLILSRLSFRYATGKTYKKCVIAQRFSTSIQTRSRSSSPFLPHGVFNLDATWTKLSLNICAA